MDYNNIVRWCHTPHCDDTRETPGPSLNHLYNDENEMSFRFIRYFLLKLKVNIYFEALLKIISFRECDDCESRSIVHVCDTRAVRHGTLLHAHKMANNRRYNK